MTYDSTEDTQKHIRRVQELIGQFCISFQQSAYRRRYFLGLPSEQLTLMDLTECYCVWCIQPTIIPSAMRHWEPLFERTPCAQRASYFSAAIAFVIAELQERGRVHDQSKLVEPEKSVFDRVTQRLSSEVYGSPEHTAARAELGEALVHHYTHNSHHPEHYPNGIDGMSLLDYIEMFADWRAAGERYKGGNLADSLRINKERWNISDQLTTVFENTAKELRW